MIEGTNEFINLLKELEYRVHGENKRKSQK